MSATQAFLRAGGRLSALLAFFAVAAIAGTLIACIVTPGIALAGTTASKQISAFQSLPSDLEITPLDQKTRIYAKARTKQVLLASFFAQNRDIVKADQVPDTVRKAAIAAEDVRFFQHGPIDPQGIARAVVDNARGRDISGASTISQQYVKNVCIQQEERRLDVATGAASSAKQVRDQARADVDGARSKAAVAKAKRVLADREGALTKADAAAEKTRTDLASCTAKSVERKIREARYAIGLEKKYSKDEILLGYLNIAGFGGRTYGIEAASQYYYDKKATELTIGEAATLLSIVNNPEAFRLDREANLAGAKGRRDYVLNTQLRYGMISQEEHDKAVAEPIKTKITPPSTGCQTAGAASFFCTYVVNTILTSKEFGTSRSERLANLNTKGWRIYTTLDLDLQRKAQAAVNYYVPQKPGYADVGAASTSLQVGTGRVLTMVQNKTFKANGARNRTRFSAVNYNVNELLGAGAGFQPGSTFKAFTMIGWLKSGHTLNQTVNGNGRSIPLSNFTACGKPYGTGSYEFKNDNPAVDKGNYTVQRGTAGSINGVFMSLAEEQDLCDLRDIAQSMGVQNAALRRAANGDVAVDKNGNPKVMPLLATPAAAIGTASSIAPLNMATGYATIAAQGIRCDAVGIDKILDSEGKAVPIPKANCRRVQDKQLTIAAGYDLRNPVLDGTMSVDQLNDGKYLFGKTGTTDDAKDTWVMGSTTKVATAVWVGNVTGRYNLRNVPAPHGCNAGATFAVQRHCVFQAIQRTMNAKYGGASSWPTPEPQYLYGGKAITRQDARPQTAPPPPKRDDDSGRGNRDRQDAPPGQGGQGGQGGEGQGGQGGQGGDGEGDDGQ